MEKERIYLSSPTMHKEEQKFIKEAFDSNWVAPLGPHVTAFEQEVAEYTEADYTVALSSGTAAIHLALKLLGVEQGDLVFSSDLTFSATCNPIVYEKAVPVFIDAEPDTWNMSPQALRRAFEQYGRPKAVICAYLYGTPAKIDELAGICAEYDTPFIEDAAESLGSTYKGRHTGTIGDLGIYSFNGNKIITTSGGGMLVAKEEDDVRKALFLATQARDPARHYQHSQIGYNYRMSNILAGIGRGQLLHLEEHKAKKQAIYRQYRDGFADIPEISMNPLNPDGDANNWLSCMIIAPDCPVTPDEILDALADENIEGRPIWKPMHEQPVFEACGFLPHWEYGPSVGSDIFARGLCLPSDIKNKPKDMKQIIGIIRECFGK